VSMAHLYPFLESLLTDWGLSPMMTILSARLVVLLGVAVLAALVTGVTRQYIVRLIEHLIVRTSAKWDDILVEERVFRRLAYLAPAVVFYLFSGVVFPYSQSFQTFVQRVSLAFIIIVSCIVLNSVLNAAGKIYRQTEYFRHQPIRAYLQVVKLFLYVIASILVVSVLIAKSPWALLSGIGALTAIIMLVFKDSILGFVASLQLVFNDMVKAGDWIEMPKYGADGDVIEVTINTVKVRNWDRTITTIPTYALISDSFKNWRGMSESGGRRIKRSVNIDLNSIQFCSSEMLERFKRYLYIREYIEQKEKELEDWNREQGFDTAELVNGRRLTNIGVFREYAKQYLHNHSMIHQDMTFLVRHLQPTEKGLPIEIYVFSKDQRWALKPISYLGGYRHSLVKRKPLFFSHKLYDRLRVEKLHRAVVGVFLLTNIVDGDNVWMFKSCGRSSFTYKALANLFVCRKLFEEDFDRHDTIERWLHALIDNTHPAATDFFKNLVLTDCLCQ